MEIINQILAFDWASLATGILTVLGGASIIAKLTPTEADDKVIQAIVSFIHTLGLTKKDV
jgi:hypothetical protein